MEDSIHHRRAAAQEEEGNVQLYLTAAPGDLPDAGRWGVRLAHVAYRIGPGSILLRQNLLLRTQGGLLTLSDADAPAVGRPRSAEV